MLARDGGRGHLLRLGWRGNYGSHVVGIIGDFVPWYGEASNRTSTVVTPTQFGDYLHVRLAYSDTRFFSGFGGMPSIAPRRAASPPITYM